MGKFQLKKAAKCWCGSGLTYGKCCHPEEPKLINGYINRFSFGEHTGIQPIRVLSQDLLRFFQETYFEFKDELLFDLRNGLNDKIKYYQEETKISSTPASISSWTRQIILQETFLSYIWCNAYFVFVYRSEDIRLTLGRKVTSDFFHKAESVRQYGWSLLNRFSDWNKQVLPNPELYLPEDKFYIDRTNRVYLYAVNFIICHEYSHYKLNHFTYDDTKSAEYEADKNSIEMILKRIKTKSDKIIAITGILVGLFSLLFMGKVFFGFQEHPDTDDRLKNALEIFNIQDEKSHVYSVTVLCIHTYLINYYPTMLTKLVVYKGETVRSVSQKLFLILEQIKAGNFN